jgi:membrane-bound lytic murein transglycosylase MltF
MISLNGLMVPKKEYANDLEVVNEQIQAIYSMLNGMVNDRKEPLNEIHKLFDSIIKIESSYDVNAISNKNAIGLMQIQLSTAKEVANNPDITEEDLKIPEINVLIGIKYFFQLLKKYDNDVYTALEAYNRGMGTIEEELNSNGEINRKYSLKVMDRGK